jgi:predicted nucleic acid-binding protein
MTFVLAPRAIVIDASVAVPFLAASAGIDTFQAWRRDDVFLLAPAHFPAEVANALLRSVRLGAAEVVRRMDLLATIGVETADRGVAGLRAAIDLAHRHRLSVYDALYLHLAIDVEAELASADNDLIRAATAEGVTLATNA